ncbi:MAG TPA: phospho-sugar mutase [Vicinamibacteria bacterium]|nr:phospho-sugar mutase [Vicinamibacteria bacterium]
MTEPELRFGTAGIRGILGDGPGTMNRSLVVRVTYGLVRHLLSISGAKERGIVVARDARRLSDVFQDDVASVASGMGMPVFYMEGPQPTPLLAFAVKELGAAAGVVITASHNPPEYNGYKVYWQNGAQIIPPIDSAILAAIEQAPPASAIPRAREWRRVDLEETYLDAVAGLTFLSGADKIRIAYTALHGCGQKLFLEALSRQGLDDVHPVAEQAEPDGAFPTVRFPNPEEPGSMDHVIALAQERDCDIALAHDPDADRLGAAVRDRRGDYVTLNGNEIGVLLAHHILNHTRAKKPLVVSTIVSSRMLSEMARRLGVRYEDTLTGFKWIANAALRIEAEERCQFVYGFEEALGYAIGTVVRDKDGIGAGLVLAEMAASLKSSGKTLLDELASLHGRYGYFATRQKSLADVASEDVVARLERWRKPAAHREGVLVYDLDEGGRVAVRPSGTEPKLKFYLEVVEPFAEHAPARAKARLDALERAFLGAATGVG